MCKLCNFMAADPEKLGFCSFTTFNIFIGTKCDNVLYRHRCTKCNLEWDACKQKTAHKTDHNIVLLHKDAKEAKLESVSFTGADKDTTTRKDVYATSSAVTGPSLQVNGPDNPIALQVCDVGFSVISCKITTNNRHHLSTLFNKVDKDYKILLKTKKTQEPFIIGKRRYVPLTIERLRELPLLFRKKLLVPIIKFSNSYFGPSGAHADSCFLVTPKDGPQQEPHSDVQASLRGKVVVCLLSFQSNDEFASTMILPGSMFIASHQKFSRGTSNLNEFQPASTAEEKKNIVLFDSAVLHYGAANNTGSDVVKLEINLYDKKFTERPDDFKKVNFNYDIKKNLFTLEELLLE